MGLEIARKAADLTKTNKDNHAVAFLIDCFNQASRSLSDDEKEKLAVMIQNDKGLLKDVKLGFDLKTKKVTAGVGGLGVEYNPNDGSIGFMVKNQG